MHKKMIRGTAYYYTSIREKGKIKTIYLGKDPKKAKEKEIEIKNQMSKKTKLSLRERLKSLIKPKKKK